MHRKEFLDKVQAATGIAEREKVERATETTLDTLRGRVTPDEAEDVAAQLPSDLKEMWGGGSDLFWPG